MKLISTSLLTFLSFVLVAQTREQMPLKFIDKVEIFGGPSLSFNRGNMFVENYKGDYANENFIENKRLIKIGYSFGVGFYHPISNWLDINARVLWEVKGSKSELDVPLNPVNDDRRLNIESTYTYRYATVNLAPVAYVGKNRKWSISLGVYYSFLKDVKGYELTKYFEIDYSTNPFTTTDVVIEDNFIGRKIRGFRDDGGVNSISFIPGTKSFKNNDYGVMVGLSYSLRLPSSSRVVICIYSQLGLQNINIDEPMNILSNPPEKNNSITTAVSYVLSRPLKKSKLQS